MLSFSVFIIEVKYDVPNEPADVDNPQPSSCPMELNLRKDGKGV